MIVFQMIGLLLASGFCLWLGVLGFFAALYDGIGGAGSVRGVLVGLLFAVVGVGSAIWLWVRFSPLSLVVAS